MSRKKLAKTAKFKKTTSPKSKKAVKQTPDQMEKHFKSLPNQLAAEYRQTLAAFKQQEKQLADAHKKAEFLSLTIKTKCETLTGNKLKSAKKGYAESQKAVKGIWKELQNTQKQLQAFFEKQAKWTAVAKEWNNFESQLMKKVKMQSEQAFKPKVKSSKRRKASVEAVTENPKQNEMEVAHETEEMHTQETL